MKILAVETTTSRHSVAVLEGAQVVIRSDEDAKGAHASRLVPTIDQLLQASGIKLTSLDGLAVSVGPGSFTGIRVGLATMLGFRSVTGLPLVTVPTLEGLAWNLPEATRPLCPILKARTGEVYWALYQWEQRGRLKQVLGERVGSLELAVQAIQGPTLMLGEGWQAYRSEFRRLLGERAADFREAPFEAMSASAVSVGLAGLERLARGDVAKRGVSPQYVQRAEAEVKRDRGVTTTRVPRTHSRLAPKRKTVRDVL